MLRIAVPSVLQQSTVSIRMMIVQAVVIHFGTQALAGYSATMSRECIFTDICIYLEMQFHRMFPKSWCKENRTYQKRISCCTGVRFMFCSSCFIIIEDIAYANFFVILGKDGTALLIRYQGII